MSVNTLGALKEKIRRFAEDEDAIEDDSSDDRRVFMGFLTEACDVVRSCDSEDPGFGEVVSKASEAINEAVGLAYENLEFDFLRSFAHSDEFPVLMGPHKDDNVFSHRMSGLLDLMKQWMGTGRMKPENSGMFLRFPNSWKSTLRPHPLSTLLSRFEGDIARAPQGATPLLDAINDARCEITSDSLEQPTGLTIGGRCMVVTSMGGWKSRTPILNYYFLDENTSRDAFPLIARQSEVGLTEIAFTSAIDESNKLIFVADTSRAKSYAWGNKESGEIYEDVLPTHTLQTDNHHGPLHVLSPGRVLRGARWDDTHRTQVRYLWHLEGRG